MSTVLIADDDTDISDILRRILTRAGLAVLTAADGLDALTTAAAALPDLILTDLDMPRMDGLQLCTAIRATPQTAAIPVAVFSGSLLPGDPRPATALACRAWLKPLTNSALIAGVHELLAAGRHRHTPAHPC
ncbi:response regulator [Actinoplanes couchii]|uniref:Response regulatory domain-containing protein n=1 Tax=Actinoplanes couchii TaxID=403638 RepID=A0ABQ3XSU4_9ACTN|nr:response regulator [Actinoplanes couchii]MDR6324057.1 CheY-like chemotaxis protein [Actinoplanes couchii]GID61584.1 hypothetical protein Aco03nite_099880 [Actinoplanes couchii]